MAKINPNENIQTMEQIMPVIYAASIPYDTRWKDGWLKIGEARRQYAGDRLAQEGHEIDSDLRLIWERNALFEGNPIAFFSDKDFHKYIKNEGVECAKRRASGNDMEVFKIDSDDALKMLNDFRANRGLAEIEGIQDYILRDEQSDAVDMAYAYSNAHPGGEFLWNAKPRFGKTLATYDLARKLKAKKVLIVTNRPAIANSWYSDYMEFIGRGEEGYFFISETDALKGKKGIISYDTYKDDLKSRQTRGLEPVNMIYFLSLQDLKGSKYFGGDIDKLREISIIEWDMLVVDEAHEGVDTFKTDTAFNFIKRKFTLHLSGTPFKALSNEKFKSDAIFNWTYTDEQKKKAEYANRADNPYACLPRMNMYTYQMSEIVAEKLQQGIEIQGETEEYAFDLGEFFKTKELSNGAISFIYGDSVDVFLDSLTTKEKYPFSTEKLRNELKHTLWLLDRVDSVNALAKKLEKHPVFKDYKVIIAAGKEKRDEDSEVLKSYDKVVEAIKKYDKTITLSVGQLTTGITIPEWTAVLMLSNISSPALYMQAAFRAQNPCTLITEEKDDKGNPVFKGKENCYVFDFDPARTLTVVEKFANNLNPKTANGGGTLEERQQNIKELLNFFPVIGEDENGELVELNVEQVLTIPRKIRSQEVVRRGFMSNFLFNISNVFNIPKVVMDTLNQLEPVKDKPSKTRTEIVVPSAQGFDVDDDGNVSATDEHTAETVQSLFGDKVYTTIDVPVSDLVEDASEPDKTNELANTLASMFERTGESVVAKAREQYGTDMRKSDNGQLTSQFKSEASQKAQEIATSYKIRQNNLEKERDEALQHAVEELDNSGKTSVEIEKEMGEVEQKINQEYAKKKEELKSNTTAEIQDALSAFEESTKTTTAKTMEEKKEQRRATNIMDDVRDRLRGFSRTIPSFIMAYSDSVDESGKPVNITLKTFDEIVPDDVFREVTSISLEQFRQLRDGFDYEDEDGTARHFDGNVFDQVVFDDAVAEFITLKKKLSDYFNENNAEDIFDYIPPQKTNQIFTPKNVVRHMADLLEKENPGCFDDPNATFIDPYMKSGLYITEIVKRLYRSPKMIETYPDEVKRLQHIFDHQVYGLAPTKIIYAISMNYIVGFAKERGIEIDKSHFVHLDAVPYVQGQMDVTLKEKLDEIFGADPE